MKNRYCRFTDLSKVYKGDLCLLLFHIGDPIHYWIDRCNKKHIGFSRSESGKFKISIGRND